MKHFRSPIIILAGVALVITGFLYDFKFAGLPFQDPSAEMRANWLYHKEIASNVIFGGSLIFLIGLLWMLLSFVSRLFKNREKP